MQLLKDLAYNDLVNEVRRGVKTDWLAQPLQNVFNHSHSLNVSGGVESIRYGLDLNYGTHNGAMAGSYRDNAGAGLTLDYRNKGWLQIMNSVSFNVTRSTGLSLRVVRYLCQITTLLRSLFKRRGVVDQAEER